MCRCHARVVAAERTDTAHHTSPTQMLDMLCHCTVQDVRTAALEFLFNLAVSNGPLTQQTLRWLVTSLTPSPADVAYLSSQPAQRPADARTPPQAQQSQLHPPAGGKAQHAQSAAAATRSGQDSANGNSGSELSTDAAFVVPGV